MRDADHLSRFRQPAQQFRHRDGIVHAEAGVDFVKKLQGMPDIPALENGQTQEDAGFFASGSNPAHLAKALAPVGPGQKLDPVGTPTGYATSLLLHENRTSGVKIRVDHEIQLELRQGQGPNGLHRAGGHFCRPLPAVFP